MGFGPAEGPEKRRRLLWSMAVLAIVVVGAGLATRAVTEYFHSRDPIYQCIGDPLSQPYQLSVPVIATEDGAPAVVQKGVGIKGGCTLPVHTLQENVIHVAYSQPYQFTVGHFIYNWLGQDLSRYSAKVFVNGVQQPDFLDVPLKQGDSVKIELTTRR